MKYTGSYLPDSKSTNDYTKIIKRLLSNYIELKPTSFKEIIFDILKLNLKRMDFVFLNWIDNDFINNNGSVSIKGVIKVVIKLFILKVKYRRLILVKHNNFPHSTNMANRKKAKFLNDLLYNHFFKSITHSPVMGNNPYYYVPHPLYPVDKVLSGAIKDYYIIFGRIEPYKKIHDIISILPENTKLMIIGPCDNSEYLTHLKKLSNNKKITIISEYLSDMKLNEYFNNCKSILITHSDEDMIVSGSIFYALSKRVPIISITSDFINWLASELGDNYIKHFGNIKDIANYINKNDGAYILDEILDKKIESLFSDKVVDRALKNIINLNN